VSVDLRPVLSSISSPSHRRPSTSTRFPSISEDPEDLISSPPLRDSPTSDSSTSSNDAHNLHRIPNGINGAIPVENGADADDEDYFEDKLRTPMPLERSRRRQTKGRASSVENQVHRTDHRR
jgi:hypothetical protein